MLGWLTSRGLVIVCRGYGTLHIDSVLLLDCAILMSTETIWLCPGIGRYSMDNYYYQDLEVSLRFGTGWCLLTNTQVFWKNALSLWRISERLRDWLCCKSLMTLATLTFLCECWSVWSSIWDWRCIKTVPSGIALDIADALFGIDYREAVIFIAVVVVGSTMLTDPSGQLNRFRTISQSHLVEPINVLYSCSTCWATHLFTSVP